MKDKRLILKILIGIPCVGGILFSCFLLFGAFLARDIYGWGLVVSYLVAALVLLTTFHYEYLGFRILVILLSTFLMLFFLVHSNITKDKIKIVELTEKEKLQLQTRYRERYDMVSEYDSGFTEAFRKGEGVDYRPIMLVRDFSGSLAHVRKDLTYSLIDENGSEIIPFLPLKGAEKGELVPALGYGGFRLSAYERFMQLKSDLTHGYLRFREELKRFGFLTYPKVKWKYGAFGESAKGLTQVTLYGKQGAINDKGELIVPTDYDAVIPIKGGGALVSFAGKWGYFNAKGNNTVKLEYDSLGEFIKNLAIAKKNGKYGLIGKEGRQRGSFMYDSMSGTFSSGFLPACREGKCGFLDRTGKEATPFIYEDVRGFVKGFAVVKRSGKFGYIDARGKEVVSPVYDEATDFSDDLAHVRKGGSWGCIDMQGRPYTAFVYEEIAHFSEGLAGVKRAGSWGFIDRAGKEIIPPKYEEIRPYANGIAFVKLAGKFGAIDAKGAEKTPFKYESLSEYKEGMIGAKLGGKYGFLNEYGKERGRFEFDSISAFSGGVARVRQEGRYGYFYRDGYVGWMMQ